MSLSVRILGRKNKKRKSKGVFVSKKSIGTIIIGGVPYTYNANLQYDGTAEKIIDDIIEDYEKTQRKRKKKKIRVRRK